MCGYVLRINLDVHRLEHIVFISLLFEVSKNEINIIIVEFLASLIASSVNKPEAMLNNDNN